MFTTRLQTIIRYLLMAVLFVPLLYTPFTLYPSYYGKTAIFQLLVGIAFLLYLILVVKKEVEKPKLTPIFWLLIIYLGIRIITGFFGLDAEKSFWGNQGRMGGNFTWLHFFVFFFLLTQFFKTKKDWFKLIKIAVFASFLVALTGVFQFFNITFFGLWQLGESSSGITGIIGNSIPFASYILFSIWFGVLIIYDCLRNKNFKTLPIWILILITNITVVFWSETKGVIYIFIASIPFAIFLLAIVAKKRVISLILLLLVFVLLVGTLFIFINQSADFVVSNKYLLRIVDTTNDLASNTLQTRLLNWQIVYQGWVDSPRSFLIGYGTENYDRIFDRYYNPEFLRYSFYETVGDKPHNILLEVVNASGILGLLAYLGIFSGVIWTLIISAHKNRISKISAIILSLAFLTYLGQNLAEFDSTNVLILFFLGLGLVVSIDNKIDSKKIKIPNIIIYFLFIMTCLGIWFGTIQPIKASYYTLKSQEHIYENQENWGRYAKKALETPSVFHNENRTHVANSAFFINASGLFNISYKNIESLKILHEKLGESVLEHPDIYAYKHRFAQIESMMGEYVDKKYFDDAEKTFQELDKENPHRQAVGLAWGQMRLIRGDTAGSVEILQKIVNKNPNYTELHWYLGLALLENGERKGGISELKKSVELGGFALGRMDNVEFLVALLQEEGEYEEIVSIYEDLVAPYESYVKNNIIFGPECLDITKRIYPRLAATYAEIGEIEKAIETLEKAVKLDPDLIDEARDFIQLLGLENGY